MVEAIRLSPQQKHLWALQQGAGQHAYQARCVVHLEGKLDKAALRAAVEQVVRRHEILRTTFRTLPGMHVPVQMLASPAPLELPEINLTGLAARAQELELEQLSQHMMQPPFVHESSPLRLALVCLAANRHRLLLSLPAACADALTLRNVVRELSQAYADPRDRQEQPTMPLQYADVSEVFNDLLETPETETGRLYWQQQDLTPLLAGRLPFETEPAGPFTPRMLAAQLQTEVGHQLNSVSQALAVPPAVFLLACWQLLLGRLTGQTDVIVGTAYDGRDYEGLAEALGLFARHLPVRCRLAEQQRLPDVLQHLRQITDEVYEWQDYFSPEQHGRGARVGAEAFYLPYCFEFEQPADEYVARDLSFAIQQQYVCCDRFKVKLSCQQQDAAPHLALHYDSACYSAEHIAVLLCQFQTLLISALDDPHSLIAELQISGPEEQQQLLVGFNQTEVVYPPAQSLQQLFEAQASRTPERVAVIFDEQRVTYEEVNSRANQLAHRLQALGVGPETCVGLYVERSTEMVIGLLGILKAGGTYTPLDAATPPERLTFILDEARVAHVVTQAALQASLPDRPLQTILLDADSPLLNEAPQTNPLSGTTPANLAYVIYTSGSTGRPKGVMIEHGAAINLSFALREAVYAWVAEPIVVGLNAPLIFDASIKQLLQLLHGHTIDVLPEEVRSVPEQFLAYTRRHKLSVFDCTPSQLKSLLAAGLTGQAAKWPAAVLVGGESLDAPAWQLLAKEPRAAFFNLYGPTECTVDATFCRVQSAPRQPTIGRPLANMQVYLLDDTLKPVPLGMTGEIYIGGAGLARGYLAQPALTAERFLPNPFSRTPGSRLYKTGDLARYLPDGTIKFLGRNDFQIKLHGFRIELPEIEAVLVEHPSVAAAAVVNREVVAGAGEQLVAYVVPRGQSQQPGGADFNGTDWLTDLRGFLRQRLPEHMVPSSYVVLAKLPLTASGKIDRGNLPDPQQDAAAARPAFEAPRNQLERTIALIWQEVLQVDSVGIHDNFFDLGGRSLTMAGVFDRLQTTFGEKLKMVEMFRHPTVSTLAQYLRQEPAENSRLENVADSVQQQRAARARQRRLQQRDEKGQVP